MSELFPDSAITSEHPRVAWLAERGLVLTKTDTGRFQCALDEWNLAKGDDEDEAIANYCYSTKTPFPAFLTPP